MPKTYYVAIVLCATVFGMYVRSLMIAVGFSTGFMAAAFLVGGAACAYAAFQFLFAAVLRVALPTRSNTVAYTEMTSNAAVVLLLPYIFGFDAPWPHPYLERLEPVVYFGLFGGAHALVKLATLYASLEGEAEERSRNPGLLIATPVCLVAAVVGLANWYGVAEKDWPGPETALSSVRVGNEYAIGRSVPEGATYRQDLSSYKGQMLTVRWGLADSANTAIADVERVHLTVTLRGDWTTTYSSSKNLRSRGWTEFNVPQAFFPANVRECAMRWTSEAEPGWYRRLGLRPIIYPEGDTKEAPRELMMSGPFEHLADSATDSPSFLVMSIDGLAAKYVTLMGHSKETTPSIDELGQRSLSFPNAYSPSSDVAATTATIFSGVARKRGGTLNREALSIPRILRERHYVSAAFTEGEDRSARDLVSGSGLAEVFEVLDPSQADTVVGLAAGEGPPETLTGSAFTIEKAAAWLDAHAGMKFLLFVRLRELETFSHENEYGPGFLEKGERARPIDTYESALLYIDRHLGYLFKVIETNDDLANTCIILTSSYGHSFSLGRSGAKLEDPTLRVPIILFAPGSEKTRRLEKVGLDQIAPTIATLAGLPEGEFGDEKSLLRK